MMYELDKSAFHQREAGFVYLNKRKQSRYPSQDTSQRHKTPHDIITK